MPVEREGTDAERLKREIASALKSGALTPTDLIDCVRESHFPSATLREANERVVRALKGLPAPAVAARAAKDRASRVAAQVWSFVLYPLLLALLLRSAEFEALNQLVNNMCVWCYAGSLSTPDCYLNWTYLWRAIRASGPESPFWFFVVGTTVGHMFVFWTYCGILHALDLRSPAWIRRYKVQPTKNAPLDPVRLWKGIRLVLFNQLCISVPLTALVFPFFADRIDAPLPDLSGVALHLTAAVVAEEIVFYYGHRLLHTPYFYKRIHKIHHEWKAPIGLVSLYAHPLEHMIGNLLPVVAGPMLTGMHVSLLWVWFHFGICTTINTHCGYHLPGLFSPRAHDFHHEKFNENFGVMGWLDVLHGTDQAFRRTKSFREHKVYWSLRPPWEPKRIEGGPAAKPARGEHKKEQ
jgi:methylsterol monooxygenase